MEAGVCARCGAPLVGRRRFCTNCGAPAGQQATAPRQAETSAPESIPSEPVLVVRVSVLKHLLRPRRWALWAVLVGAGVGGWLLGLPPAGVLAVAGLTVVVVAWWWLDWRANRLEIYPDRIVRHEGWLNRTERTLPLWRIQDVVLRQRWYGLGWVSFETAGEESDAGFGPIVNAGHVRDTIYRLIRQHETEGV